MKQRLALLFLVLLGCGSSKIRPASGDLRVEPAELRFGEVPSGTAASRALRLENTGRAPISIVEVVFEGADASQFSAEVTTPLVVSGAGELVSLRLSFSAVGVARGERRATLRLVTDVSGEVEVPLHAVVFDEPLPALDGGPNDAPDGGPVVEPDLWVAFDSNRVDGSRDIYAVRADGSDLRQLTDGPFTEMEPAFSPDGLTLAYASDQVDFTFQLFLMELSTGAVTQVTRGTKGATQPAWSPDGKRLAFHRDIGVYTIAVDGTDERHIIDGLNALNAYQYPAYLPEGNWLVTSRTNQIDMIRTDGTDLRHVVQNTTLMMLSPSPSPSGTTIAFEAGCGGPGIRSAPVSRLSHACDTSEVTFPGRRPAWGPKLIAFETVEANADIQVVSPTGGAPANITAHSADDRNPAWSPRGTVLR